MQTITDTIPAEILESVHRYYHRNGYKVQSMLLVSSGLWHVTYVK